MRIGGKDRIENSFAHADLSAFEDAERIDILVVYEYKSSL